MMSAISGGPYQTWTLPPNKARVRSALFNWWSGTDGEGTLSDATNANDLWCRLLGERLGTLSPQFENNSNCNCDVYDHGALYAPGFPVTPCAGGCIHADAVRYKMEQRWKNSCGVAPFKVLSDYAACVCCGWHFRAYLSNHGNLI